MGKVFALLAMLFWTSGALAGACPVPAQVAPPALPPLLASGAIGGQVYYCMPSVAPSTVGDLSPSQWAKEVQICNTSCSYEPMNPSDPHTLLIPTQCGLGWHDTQFMVQPPPPPKNGVRLEIVTSGCRAIAPSKARPLPSPAASPAA